MGCCCSSSSSKNKGKRNRWTPGQRKPHKADLSVDQTFSGYSDERYHGYDNPAAGSGQSDASAGSSRTFDAPMFVGLWCYTPGGEAEQSIRQGDRFRLIGDPNGESDPDWLFVTRDQPGDRRWTGYIPKTYVGRDGSLDLEPWYFGELNGKGAERLLHSMPGGSFLVRKRHPFIVSGSKPDDHGKASVRAEACRPGRQARSEYALTIKYNQRIVSRPIYQYLDSSAGKTEIFLSRQQTFLSIPHMISCFTIDGPALRDNNIPCVLKSWPPKPSPPRVEMSLEAQRNWREIPRSQIELGHVKGEGHFGRVYEAVWTTSDGNKVSVAVKALRQGSTRAKRKFLQEAVTMKNLSHKNLVKLYGIVSEDEPFWIVTEFVKDGSLLWYLRHRKTDNALLSEKILVDVCAQICDGMQFLEEKQVVHADLAARNVLVAEETPGVDPVLLIKVADFGLARLVDPTKIKEQQPSSKSSRSATVPTKWTAPEALKDDLYSSASDVWSFGIVAHEVFSHGLEPYGILRNQAVRDYVLKQRKILTQHPTVPNRIYDMMKKCFSFDPACRPTFHELFAFFQFYYRKPGESSVTDV